MRGLLDNITLAKIGADLPESIALFKLGLPLSPFIASTAFEPECSVPVATICLNGVCTILNDASFLIIEARANLVWYREQSPTSPNEATATPPSMIRVDRKGRVNQSPGVSNGATGRGE